MVDRDADVVLGGGAELLLLRLRQAVADPPEGVGLGLVGGDGGVGDQPAIEQWREEAGEQSVGGFFVGRGGGCLDQGVPRVLACERGAGPVDLRERGVEAVAGQDFEPFDAVGARLERAQHRQRGIRIGETEPRDGALVDRGDELEADRGDQAQCPFRPDQQLVDRRAAIVFLEPGEAIVDRAVGKHRLDPLDQSAHRAEAQHLRTAGVGRGQPADGRAAA